MLPVAAVIMATVLGWGWLTTAGLAPIILSTLPCAAMCALGLCTNCMTSKSDSASPRALSDGAENNDRDASTTGVIAKESAEKNAQCCRPSRDEK